MRRLVSFLPVCLLMFAAIDANAQGVRGFGAPPGKLPLRGFGNPEGEDALRVMFPAAAAAVVGEDWEQARGQIGKTDGNGDGIVTEAEWAASDYQRPSQFQYNDLNQDGLITLYEQTLGFAAWRRRNERRSDARRSAARAAQPKPERASTAAIQVAPVLFPEIEARRRESWDLSAHVLRAYDINENGVVERAEFRSQRSRFGSLSGADADGDGEVDRQELSQWLVNRMPELPSEQLTLDFQARDSDKDGQVSLREYAPKFQPDAVSEFRRWDRNGDGLITTAESQNRPPSRGVEYANNEPQVLKPNATIVSRIWVEEEKVIDNVDVYVTLSKESDNYTEVHLIGPDGKRVTLYEGGGWVPWTGALILKDITFSDNAPTIRQPLRQPPNPRAVAPPGVGKADVPSLRDFQSTLTRGIWRLVVVNQNNRAGVLLRWALRVTAKAEASDEG